MKTILSVLAIGVILLSACAPKEEATIVWTKSENNLLEGAAERIENYRKGDATVLVVDADDTPVNKAVVRMEMLKHDFLFGANIFRLGTMGLREQAFEDAFVKLLNYAIVPCHWPDYEVIQGQGQEEKLMNMARWASGCGIITKGHTLLWPSLPGRSAPSWAGRFSTEQLDEAVHERVTSMVERFRGVIDHWDVFNEPTHLASYNAPLGSWVRAYTPARAIARTLEWARASNQEATLLVNDWRTDDGFHAILEDIIEAGAQFDAIGIQSHMHTGTWSLNRVWDTCERFKDLNVPLHFTEVTVLSGALKTDDDWWGFHPGWDTTPEGEAVQAEYAVALYTILFSHPSVQAITWWDLTDWGAWQGAPAGLLRRDMSPKPAYERLMELIHQKWWTNTDSKTNKRGEATIRGFYGQYLLTVELGKKSVQKLVHLRADHENVFEVQLP